MSTKKPSDEPRFLTDVPAEPPSEEPLDRVPLAGPPCPLFGVAVSDKDRFIAVAQDDGLVALWQPVLAEHFGTSAPFLVGLGHTRSARSIAFEPACAREYTCVVSGSVDCTIRTWHVGDETKNSVLRHHESSVMCLAFDAAATRLVSGSEDKTIAIASWPDGRLERSFVAHERSVLAVAISPDGTQIASGGADERAYLWSIDGTKVARLDDDAGHGYVWGLQFLDDERIVFTKGPRLFEWNTSSGSRVLHTLQDTRRHIHGLAVRSDRAEIAFASNDVVVTMDRDGGRVRRRTGHAGAVNGIAYLGDGRIASTGDDGALLVWGDGEEPVLRLRAGSA